jgi:16S rRNA (cytosine967-C5)-methyltransferase
MSADNVFERRVVRQAFLEWLASGHAADRVLNETLREHRVGAAQRTLVGDAFFELLRHKGHLLTEPARPENPGWLRELDEAVKQSFLPASALLDRHARAKPAIDEDPEKHFRKVHGAAPFLAREMAAAPAAWNVFLHQMMEAEAPLALRVNTLKARRDDEMKRLAPYKPQPGAWLPETILFERRWAVTQDPAYAEGKIEIQDEHSQLVAWVAAPQPGEKILDLCAGAGGKTLHLAALAGGKGEIFAYDIDKRKLVELSARARRAGFTNLRVSEKMPPKEELFDLVVVDAPCSGLGTLRRGPDRLYAFGEEEAKKLTRVQVELLERAFAYLKPGGRVVYATCTVRPAENEHIVRHFLEKGRKPGDVRTSVSKAIGAQAAGFLAQAAETPAARIAASVRSTLPPGAASVAKSLEASCLTLGPSSHASGGLRGDGFFVAVLH